MHWSMARGELVVLAPGETELEAFGHYVVAPDLPVTMTPPAL